MQNCPEELIVPPSRLVALVSDASYVDMLAVALKTAGGVGSNTLSMRYEPRPASHVFVRKQCTHTDYETYVPAGILSSRWMQKHQNDIPAVVVLALDIDLRQSSSEWGIVELSIASSIHAAKEACRPRLQELHVVLIHEKDTPRGAPSSSYSSSQMDDRALLETAAERVTALRRKIGLDGNSMTLLFTGDIATPGSPLIASLDAMLRDKASSYYQAQTKKVKRALVKAVLPAQAPLRIRLLFKLAHYQEFRGRPLKAQKYYTQTYAAINALVPHILQAVPTSPIAEALLPQIKLLAEYVNFKIMHAYLSAGHSLIVTPSGITGITGAQAATMQFAHHIRTFENSNVGGERGTSVFNDSASSSSSSSSSSLPSTPFPACTHWAWLSRQYLIAAELLQLNLPRPTLETRPQQVPAYYYHTAALYAIRRRKAAEIAGLIPSFALPAASSSTSSSPTVIWSAENIELVTKALASFSATMTTEAIKVAQSECKDWDVYPSLYVGGPPQVSRRETASSTSSNGESTTTTATSSSSIKAHAAIAATAEASYTHSETIIGLLERAQAVSLVDGGSGKLMGTLTLMNANNSTTSSTSQQQQQQQHQHQQRNDDSFADVTFARGSMFGYIPSSDTSRMRLWRQWLIADELFSQGKILECARLLAPTAATFRRHQVWPLLVRAALRMRECALLLQEKALYIASSFDLLSSSLYCSVPRIEEVFTVLASAIRTSSLAATAAATADISDFYLPIPPALPLRTNNTNNLNTSLSSSFPLPSHIQSFMSQAGAPLLSATVVFSRRIVQRGSTVTVRVLLSSNFPKTVTLDSVIVKFAGIKGDGVLAAESIAATIGNVITAPTADGVNNNQSNDANHIKRRRASTLGSSSHSNNSLVNDAAAAFNITFVRAGSATASSLLNKKQKGVIIITDPLPNKDGVSIIDLSNSVGSSGDADTDTDDRTPTHSGIVIAAPLVLEAHKTLAFEYTLRAPVIKTTTTTSTSTTKSTQQKKKENSSPVMELIQSLVSTAQEEVAEQTNAAVVVTAGRRRSVTGNESTTTAAATAAASGTAADKICTNPAAMMMGVSSSAAGGDTDYTNANNNGITAAAGGAAGAAFSTYAQQHNFVTVVCNSVEVVWSGLLDAATGDGGKSTNNNSPIRLHVVPRTLASTSGDMRAIWLPHASRALPSRPTQAQYQAHLLAATSSSRQQQQSQGTKAAVTNTTIESAATSSSRNIPSLAAVYQYGSAGEIASSLSFSSPEKDTMKAVGSTLESCVAHMARLVLTRSAGSQQACGKGVKKGSANKTATQDNTNNMTLSDADIGGLNAELRALTATSSGSTTTNGYYSRVAAEKNKVSLLLQGNSSSSSYDVEDENTRSGDEQMGGSSSTGTSSIFHNYLILSSPVAKCSIHITSPSSNSSFTTPSTSLDMHSNSSISSASSDIVVALGARNKLAITVSNDGSSTGSSSSASSLAGGVLLLSTLQLANSPSTTAAITASVAAAFASAGESIGDVSSTTPLADVDITSSLNTPNTSIVVVGGDTASTVGGAAAITTATDDAQSSAPTTSSTGSSAATKFALAVAAAVNRLQDAEETIIRHSYLLVSGGTLVVTSEGKIIPASAIGSVSTSSSQKKKEKTAQIEKVNDDEENNNNNSELLGKGFVKLSLGSLKEIEDSGTSTHVVGLAIPSLPHGAAYTTTVYLCVPFWCSTTGTTKMPVTSSSSLIEKNLVAPEHMRCGIAATLHAIRAQQQSASSSEQLLSLASFSGATSTSSSWLECAAKEPHNIITARTLVSVSTRSPLRIACGIEPDASVPVLDMYPLLRGYPFMSVPPAAIGGSSSSNNTGGSSNSSSGNTTGSMIRGAFVRQGTQFTTRLAVIANTNEEVTILDAHIVRHTFSSSSTIKNDESKSNDCSGVEVVHDDLDVQLAGKQKVAVVATKTSSNALKRASQGGSEEDDDDDDDDDDGGSALVREAIAKLIAGSINTIKNGDSQTTDGTLMSGSSNSNGGGVALLPSQAARAALVWNALSCGVSICLGVLELSVAVGAKKKSSSSSSPSSYAVHKLYLSLPTVSIAAPPIRCDVTWPQVAIARIPVQLGIRITNGTPHFQALEVGLQPPAASLFAGVLASTVGSNNSNTPTAATQQQIQFAQMQAQETLAGVPAFEPLDRFTRYIVELLPGASKSVSFHLMALQTGYTALPSLVVKATKTEGRPEARINLVPGAVVTYTNSNNGAANSAQGATSNALFSAPQQQPGAPVTTSSAAVPPAGMGRISIPPPTTPNAGGGGGGGGGTPLIPTSAPLPTPVPEVMAVLPVGVDGIPGPRGIYVLEPQQQ